MYFCLSLSQLSVTITCIATFPQPLCCTVAVPVESGSSSQVDLTFLRSFSLNLEIGVPVEQRLFIPAAHGPHPLHFCPESLLSYFRGKLKHISYKLKHRDSPCIYCSQRKTRGYLFICLKALNKPPDMFSYLLMPQMSSNIINSLHLFPLMN